MITIAFPTFHLIISCGSKIPYSIPLPTLGCRDEKILSHCPYENLNSNLASKANVCKVFAKLFVNWSRGRESLDVTGLILRGGHTKLGPCRPQPELGWVEIDQSGEIHNPDTGRPMTALR